jgi:hypothetical protein
MGIVLDKDARLDAVLAIFEEKGIIISTPTTIQFPLSFSIGDTAFYSKADLKSTTELVSEFISKAGVGKRILMWEEENRINFGFIKVVDNTSELHYIAIEVGS